MKALSGKRCYCCGGVATSGEHVPPKQLFKPFQCDSITVPSCDKHNTKKSGRDQAIVSALLLPLHIGRHRYSLEPEIEQAIEAALPSFERAKRNAVRTTFLKDPPNGLEDLPDLAYLAPSVNMSDWIRQLTAGLIYDGIGMTSTTIGFSKSIIWSPDWFTADRPAPIEYAEAARILELNHKKRTVLDSLSWQQGWSAHPRPYPAIIYSFQFHFTLNREIIIRHRFYNRYAWYVFFMASNRNIIKLQKRVNQL